MLSQNAYEALASISIPLPEDTVEASVSAPEAEDAVGVQGAIEFQRRASSIAQSIPIGSRYAQVSNWSLGFRTIKRIFDIVFSILVLVVLFIPGVLLSIVVGLDTKGSPIYTQERIGRGGMPFKIFKFRTMVPDADDVEKYLDIEQIAKWRYERKVDDDPRITKLGRFLRKASIDEFPQFVNVLVGQMSTIGPRAVTEDELAWFGDDWGTFLSVRPGITGLWQVGRRNNAVFENGRRQELELLYVQEANLELDARIFMRTFRAMISGTGQ